MWGNMEGYIKRPSLDVLAAYREMVAVTNRLSEMEQERDKLISRMIQAQNIIDKYNAKDD